MIRLALLLAALLLLACGSPVEPQPPQCGTPATMPVLDSEGIPVTTATFTYCVPR